MSPSTLQISLITEAAAAHDASWEEPARPHPPPLHDEPLRVLALTAALAAASLPVVLAPGLVARAAALRDLVGAPNPYVLPEHAGLLYLAVPAVVLSGYALLLAPGVLLALALGAAARVEAWLLAALGISLVLVSAATAAVQGIVASPITGSDFMAVVAGCALLAALVTALVGRRRQLVWPPLADLTRALPLVLGPALVVAALEPKLLWEAFNGDGAHAFETARLLLHRSLPFWDARAANMASFPGLTSMTFAFPASWMVRLFGELEAAARLPFPLMLAATAAGTIELARAGRDWKPGAMASWLVWLALVPFALAMAYAASYSPYSADIGMPAAQDTLLIALFLGAAAAFVNGRLAWFAFFAALTMLSLPNGLLLLAMFLAAALLFWRPRPTRQVLMGGAILLAVLLLTAVLPPVLALLKLPQPGREYAGASLLRYFAWLQLTDVRRVLWLLVPCGIVPAAALFAWRWQDGPARALTATIAAYFVFFYVQGLTVLHHFSPVMVLPLALFWRVAPAAPVRLRRWLPLLAGAGALGAIALSLPRVGTPFVLSRTVGWTMRDRMGGYEASDAGVFQRALLLNRIFPSDWDPRVPAPMFGEPPVVWSYYAAHAPLSSPINYLIESAAVPAPAGWRRVAAEGDAALDVASETVVAAHLGSRPRVDRGAAIYTIPRSMLFSSSPNDRRISSLELARRLGVDLTPLAGRTAAGKQ